MGHLRHTRPKDSSRSCLSTNLIYTPQSFPKRDARTAFFLKKLVYSNATLRQLQERGIETNAINFWCYQYLKDSPKLKQNAKLTLTTSDLCGTKSVDLKRQISKASLSHCGEYTISPKSGGSFYGFSPVLLEWKSVDPR